MEVIIMKKILFFGALAALLSLPFASAGIGWKTGGMGGWGLYGCIVWPVYFIAASFIFSVTFWLTYGWLIGKKGSKKAK
ncbi:hypothetical protein KY358_04695 [Candidatus Woesearchaeota archaeon]|nr:hypothetical protein [Candidatus Woesearchaeota archaeon]